MTSKNTIAVGIVAVVIIVIVAAAILINSNSSDQSSDDQLPGGGDSPGETTSYTLILNTLNGTGSITEIVDTGDSFTLPDSSTISREGYTLESWCTSIDGSGTSYNPGQSITVNSNLTLYAIWEVDQCQVTFMIDVTNNHSIYQTVTVNAGDAVSRPANPNIVAGNTYYYFIGWNDQFGESWDFNDPVYEDTTLYANAERLYSTLQTGFSLYLNIDQAVQNGWTHRISWGDNTADTSRNDPQPDHQYNRAGEYTVTVESTSPSGIRYSSHCTVEFLSDSRGNMIPMVGGGSSASYDVTDSSGSSLGTGFVLVSGQTIVAAEINGLELNDSTIDRMNDLRDLSRAEVYEDGLWEYSMTTVNGQQYTSSVMVYKIEYSTSTYDLITEDGDVLEVHVGSDVGLNFVVSDHWTKL